MSVMKEGGREEDGKRRALEVRADEERGRAQEECVEEKREKNTSQMKDVSNRHMTW